MSCFDKSIDGATYCLASFALSSDKAEHMYHLILPAAIIIQQVSHRIILKGNIDCDIIARVKVDTGTDKVLVSL